MTLLSLPTFLFGPSQGARSSAILERSSDGDVISDGERRLLNDLPLAIAGWMRRRQEDEIWGCLPLTRAFLGGRILFRAAYHRDLGGEPMGLASGIYVGRAALQALDGHAERLVQLLPPPERGTAFTESPLTIDLAEVPPAADPLAIGLEWEDRAVRLLDDSPALAVAGQLLAGIGRSAPARRVLGWVTTARFPRLGGIDPRASFQLVVHRGDPPEERYLTGEWAGGHYSGEIVAAPPAWPAWQKLHAALADDPPLAEACDWAGILAAVPADQVPEALLQRLRAWPDDGPILYLSLLTRLAQGGLLSDPAGKLRADLADAAPDERAVLLSALLVQKPELLVLLNAEALLRSYPVLAGHLTPPALQVALKDLNLLDWPEVSLEHLEALPAEARFAALNDGLDRIDADPITARRMVLPVQVLVRALITDQNSIVQADLRSAALVQRIDQIQSAGKANLVTQSLWGSFVYFQRRLSADGDTAQRRQTLNVGPELPRNLAGLGRLAWLIGEAARAGAAPPRGALR